MKYIGIVFKEENSDYGIVFPYFPGCLSGDHRWKKFVKWDRNPNCSYRINERENESIPCPLLLMIFLIFQNFKKDLPFMLMSFLKRRFDAMSLFKMMCSPSLISLQKENTLIDLLFLAKATRRGSLTYKLRASIIVNSLPNAEKLGPTKKIKTISLEY